MKRLLVNDCLTCIPGTRTFWHDLQEWFGCEFCGGDYSILAKEAEERLEYFLDDSYAGDEYPNLIIRNASYFPPIATTVPTVSLLQDISPDGETRKMQEEVIKSSRIVVFNSTFTASKYAISLADPLQQNYRIIPLPVDFSLFQPQNAYALQQALSLPDNCICWIGAQSEIKGYDTFLQIVRRNPDLCFVAVFKDNAPGYGPPNMRTYTKLTHEELVKVIGACRIGLCTSRTESQHLAGIEMGACGLPLVVPPVGCYWNLKPGDWPGSFFDHRDGPSAIATILRATLSLDNKLGRTPDTIRAYWKARFDKPIIKKQWEDLVDAVEHPDRRDS